MRRGDTTRVRDQWEARYGKACSPLRGWPVEQSSLLWPTILKSSRNS